MNDLLGSRRSHASLDAEKRFPSKPTGRLCLDYRVLSSKKAVHLAKTLASKYDRSNLVNCGMLTDYSLRYASSLIVAASQMPLDHSRANRAASSICRVNTSW